jgi:zinc transport system ATP-binding protein
MTLMSKKLVEIRSLSVVYNGNNILKDIDLDIYENDFLGVIGPNGGGKTTLVKAILGLVKPVRGSIQLFFDKGSIGYMPQISRFDTKFPISVFDVVLSGLAGKDKLFGKSSKKGRDKAKKLLEQMGVIHLRKKAIGELSGGEMQRVFLCRSLISQPELLILDEPNTFVDNQFERDLFNELKKLNDRMAIMLVSHDVGTIAYYIKTIACINRKLHYHPSNIITEKQLAAYDCPLQIITHGDVPHTVLKEHDKS